MSKRGTPVDNTVIESFHQSIKRELIKTNSHKIKVEMKVHISTFINLLHL